MGITSSALTAAIAAAKRAKQRVFSLIVRKTDGDEYTVEVSTARYGVARAVEAARPQEAQEIRLLGREGDVIAVVSALPPMAAPDPEPLVPPPAPAPGAATVELAQSIAVWHLEALARSDRGMLDVLREQFAALALERERFAAERAAERAASAAEREAMRALEERRAQLEIERAQLELQRAQLRAERRAAQEEAEEAAQGPEALKGALEAVLPRVMPQVMAGLPPDVIAAVMRAFGAQPTK